jgi:ribonuclease HI
VCRSCELRCSPALTGPFSSTAPHVSRGPAREQGALLLTTDGEQFKYMVHLEFKVTNNMTEYEVLIFGLSIALFLGVRQLLVKGDS